MLENKKSRLVISFILAFALWFYVVGQMNPQTRKTYRDITITLANEQSLSDSGLAVLNCSDDSLRVTVSGKRSTINKLSKADIVATVDLTNAAEGTNKLPIDLKIPETVEIDNQSLNEITVNVEERITKTRDVRVIYSGNYPKGSEPATIKADPENVKVSGAKSIVEKVSYVKAEIDATDMTDELSSSTSDLTAVTSGGSTVENVSLSDTQCKITSILCKTRKVKLIVPVVDKSDDDYTRSTSCQDMITIKGAPADIAAVKRIKAEPVDITGITENMKIDVVPVLPEGVFIADEDRNIKLTVKVNSKKDKKKSTGEGKQTRSFTYTEDDVEIRNAGNSLWKTEQESIEVQVTGTAKQLSGIKSSDIILFVDLTEINDNGTGRADIDIQTECDREYSDIAVIPSVITLTYE